MRILVTGAAGYIGSRLVRALAAAHPEATVVATDQRDVPGGGPRLQPVVGNLAYPPFARSLITAEVDVVFHLASLVSGGAEQNFALGNKVNLDATRDLLEACRAAGHCPKFVFTSSIAVYGEPVPGPVTDDTAPSPRLSYGTQKLICELLIDDYTRRGFVDGRSLRLPTVIVRPGSANTALTGWASAIVREPLAGRHYVCPVSPATRMACISANRGVEALVRAAELPGDGLGVRRTVLLNGLSLSAGELWDAVRARARGRVTFAPDPDAQALMDTLPKGTVSARASSLGFAHGGSLEETLRDYEEETLPGERNGYLQK
jgi:nucleoside-diphosphate-sugar epimerase